MTLCSGTGEPRVLVRWRAYDAFEKLLVTRRNHAEAFFRHAMALRYTGEPRVFEPPPPPDGVYEPYLVHPVCEDDSGDWCNPPPDAKRRKRIRRMLKYRHRALWGSRE